MVLSSVFMKEVIRIRTKNAFATLGDSGYARIL